MSWSNEIEGEWNDHARLYPPLAPTAAGTACLLFGIFLSYTLYPSATSPSAMARVPAIAVGIAFLVSIWFDTRKGLRNLFRTDLLCLLGLYGLTLMEFLFPQEEFNTLLTLQQTANSLNLVLVGMAGLAIGRHLVAPIPMQSTWLRLDEISNSTLFRVFVVAGCLAYLHILMSVQFNPVALINGMLGARFSEPWARGHLGGWSSLITELFLLTYALPPLMAVVWNRRHSYAFWQLLVMGSMYLLVMFHAFAGGTRNVFITHISTFMMSYLLTLPRNTFRNTVLPILIAGFIAVYGSYHMLAFRSIGLRSYITDQVYASPEQSKTLAVDYNLFSIGLLMDALPRDHAFLGAEIAVNAITQPVPRAFWPGKPERLSVSMEDIVGADGWTVAATFVGESYMMAGWLGAIGMSLFFGALAAWWNRMAMQEQSDYALVVYALGFFAAGITMRSMNWLTTAMLPVIALIVFRKLSANH